MRCVMLPNNDPRHLLVVEKSPLGIGLVKTAEAEIDRLLREKEEIEKWAAVGSS